MNAINQVFETNDYSKFKKLLGNRTVNMLHIKRLKESFEKSYLLSPILVNEKFEIIDGQHRFEAAKQSELPVRYIKIDNYGLEEVQLLNTNMKNWKSIDYMNAFVDLGYSEYIRFQEFMTRYPQFGISVCESLLTDRLTGHSKKSSKSLVSETNKSGAYMVSDFKEGTLSIPDYKKSINNANKILAIGQYYDGFHRINFVRAILGIFRIEKFSYERLMKKLKRQPTKLQHCTNVSQYKMLIENIYNFGTRDKISLRF